MIQTKEIITYGDRSEKQGKILIEVRPLEMEKTGIKYLVVDWDISLNPPEPISSKEIFYFNEKIDQLDVYLESTYDFTGMTKSEKEWTKVKLALMLDTQTNLLANGKTIRGLNPNDWEFTPEE